MIEGDEDCFLLLVAAVHQFEWIEDINEHEALGRRRKQAKQREEKKERRRRDKSTIRERKKEKGGR